MSDEAYPMHPFEGRLLAELLVVHEAACGQPAPSRAAAGRRRGPRSLLRLTTLALIATTTLAGAAFAAKTIWNPLRGGHARGLPSTAPGAVPAFQRRQFGVLARPQNEVDRGPETERALRLLSPGFVDAIHISDVRVLFRNAERGLTAILLPVGSYGADYARLFGRGSGTNGLCLLFTAPQGPVSNQCHSPGDAPRVRMPATTSGLAFGLVPDGVASVRIRYADGRHVDAPVDDNFYLARNPRGAGLFIGIRWLAHDGGTVAALDP